MTFEEWLETLIREKGWDRDLAFEVESPLGVDHFIPLVVLVEFLNTLPLHQRKGIQKMVAQIDFAGQDILDYFEHLAKGMAAAYEAA